MSYEPRPFLMFDTWPSLSVRSVISINCVLRSRHRRGRSYDANEGSQPASVSEGWMFYDDHGENAHRFHIGRRLPFDITRTCFAAAKHSLHRYNRHLGSRLRLRLRPRHRRGRAYYANEATQLQSTKDGRVGWSTMRTGEMHIHLLYGRQAAST